MSIRALLFDYLYYLCAGTIASTGVLRQSQLGRKYFMYHGLGAALIMLAAYLGIGRSVLPSDVSYYCLASIVFIFIFSLTVGVKQKIALMAFFTGLICVLGALIMEATTRYPGPLHLPMMINSALSMLMLGFSMNAMLVGHWYLVQPKLSIDELKRVCLILIVLIALRFVWGGYSFIILLQGKNETQILKYLFNANPGIFVMMRFVWGLVGPACLAYPIWATVKMRSTQSATGILYVAVLFILIGEVLSHYLALFHQIAM